MFYFESSDWVELYIIDSKVTLAVICVVYIWLKFCQTDIDFGFSHQFARIIQKLGFEVKFKVLLVIPYICKHKMIRARFFLYIYSNLKVWGTQDFKIQNMVGSCDVKFPIRLESLACSHAAFSSVSHMHVNYFPQNWINHLAFSIFVISNCWSFIMRFLRWNSESDAPNPTYVHADLIITLSTTWVAVWTGALPRSDISHETS